MDNANNISSCIAPSVLKSLQHVDVVKELVRNLGPSFASLYHFPPLYNWYNLVGTFAYCVINREKEAECKNFLILYSEKFDIFLNYNKNELMKIKPELAKLKENSNLPEACVPFVELVFHHMMFVIVLKDPKVCHYVFEGDNTMKAVFSSFGQSTGQTIRHGGVGMYSSPIATLALGAIICYFLNFNNKYFIKDYDQLREIRKMEIDQNVLKSTTLTSTLFNAADPPPNAEEQKSVFVLAFARKDAFALNNDNLFLTQSLHQIYMNNEQIQKSLNTALNQQKVNMATVFDIVDNMSIINGTLTTNSIKLNDNDFEIKFNKYNNTSETDVSFAERSEVVAKITRNESLSFKDCKTFFEGDIISSGSLTKAYLFSYALKSLLILKDLSGYIEINKGWHPAIISLMSKFDVRTSDAKEMEKYIANFFKPDAPIFDTPSNSAPTQNQENANNAVNNFISSLKDSIWVSRDSLNTLYKNVEEMNSKHLEDLYSEFSHVIKNPLPDTFSGKLLHYQKLFIIRRILSIEQNSYPNTDQQRKGLLQSWDNELKLSASLIPLFEFLCNIGVFINYYFKIFFKWVYGLASMSLISYILSLLGISLGNIPGVPQFQLDTPKVIAILRIAQAIFNNVWNLSMYIQNIREKENDKTSGVEPKTPDPVVSSAPSLWTSIANHSSAIAAAPRMRNNPSNNASNRIVSRVQIQSLLSDPRVIPRSEPASDTEAFEFAKWLVEVDLR